jgi:hypothetical protein
MGATQNNFARKQTIKLLNFKNFSKLDPNARKLETYVHKIKAIPKILCKEINYKMRIKKT